MLFVSKLFNCLCKIETMNSTQVLKTARYYVVAFDLTVEL